MRQHPVYLDYAATTPVDPRVLEAMLPYFGAEYGNPSSVHTWGQAAEAAVERARETVARSLGASPEEIIFTSCGSESDNLALRGVARAAMRERGADHILVTRVEHHAVLRTAEQLAGHEGFTLEPLRVDGQGMVDPVHLARRLRPTTAVVSVIHANNEIGTVNPIPELSSVCRERGIPFHTDSVQAASQLEVNVGDLGVDLMSIGAHKFYGPKGVGALYVRSGVRLVPTETGGGQERGLRAGTHNVPLIVGMAEALRLTVSGRAAFNEHLRTLRDLLIRGVLNSVPEARLTGSPERRLPNHASFVFRGVDGNTLLAALDQAGYGCSSGSACKTGDPEPSDVLLALGLPREWSLGSLRVTVGRSTTAEEIGGLLDALPAIIERMRAIEARPV